MKPLFTVWMRPTCTPSDWSTNATVPTSAPEYVRHFRQVQISSQSVATTVRVPRSANRTANTLSTGSAATTTRSWSRRWRTKYRNSATAKATALDIFRVPTASAMSPVHTPTTAKPASGPTSRSVRVT